MRVGGEGRKNDKSYLVFSFFVFFLLPSFDERLPTSGTKAGPKCRLSRRPDQEVIEENKVDQM